MASQPNTTRPAAPVNMPTGESYRKHLEGRKLRGTLWKRFFQFSTYAAIVALIALLFNIVNETFGIIAVEYQIEPSTLADRPLGELNGQELGAILATNAARRLPVLVRDNLSVVPSDEFTTAPIREMMAGRSFSPDVAELTIRELTPEQQAALLADNLPTAVMENFVETEVVGIVVQESYPLVQALFDRARIDAEITENHPNARIEWYSWLNAEFLTVPMSSTPILAGVRTALLGTICGSRLPAGCRRGHLPGRILQPQPPEPDYRNQHSQPGRRPIHHLWFARSGGVRACAVSGHAGPHHHERRSHHRAAHPAGGHHQFAGSHSVGVARHSRSQLWAGRDQMADHLESGAARRHARHSDGDDPGAVAWSG
jgi:hypothetical protein